MSKLLTGLSPADGAATLAAFTVRFVAMSRAWFPTAPICSTQWAAYAFTGNRIGMLNAGEVGAPCIEVQPGAAVCVLQASLDLGRAHLPKESL